MAYSRRRSYNRKYKSQKTSLKRSRKYKKQKRRKSPKNALIHHYGKSYYDKFERCVKNVKSKSNRRYNAFAICHASIQGKTKWKRKSRSDRIRK
jgi:hypothetical protein